MTILGFFGAFFVLAAAAMGAEAIIIVVIPAQQHKVQPHNLVVVQQHLIVENGINEKRRIDAFWQTLYLSLDRILSSYVVEQQFCIKVDGRWFVWMDGVVGDDMTSD